MVSIHFRPRLSVKKRNCSDTDDTFSRGSSSFRCFVLNFYKVFRATQQSVTTNVQRPANKHCAFQNLLSCLTLDMENFHSTVHVKQAHVSKAEYCRSFGLAMKEAVKRVTTWAAYYHTSRRSWYPKPEGGLLLSQVPVIKPLPIVNILQPTAMLLETGRPLMGLP